MIGSPKLPYNSDCAQCLLTEDSCTNSCWRHEKPGVVPVKDKMTKGKPIKPSEVVAYKQTTIPPEVFDAFNELIAEHWDGHSSTVMQEEVIKRIRAKVKPLNGERIKTEWLDVEPLYRAEGWAVEYDKPGFNEEGDAQFTFKASTRRARS